MKKNYIITKKVVAENVIDAAIREKKGEIIEISLMREEVLETREEGLGFKKDGSK